MNTYQTILVERQDSAGIITMNRPERLNAMNLEMKRELIQALEDLEADERGARRHPHRRRTGVFFRT